MTARLIGTALLMSLALSHVMTGAPEPQQASGEQTRQIIAEEFLKARPAPAAASTPAAKPPAYRPAGSTNAAAAKGTVNLGLTLWRLRAATGEGARLLVQDTAAGDVTAERIDVGAPLDVGDRVRLTIESPNAGFLYVVDREVYSDGAMSDAYLIFPTSRTRQGDNAVRAGRLVDVPDQLDRPNYFTVRPSRPGQVGELITIIVSPKPIDSVTIGDKPLVLAKDVMASWEKSWTSPMQQFTQEGGAKRVWTREEQVAAADASRLLTQDDPAPQTIFRLAAKKGAPVLVTVRLPYAASNR